jgi:hypothetical protein
MLADSALLPPGLIARNGPSLRQPIGRLHRGL